MAWRIHDSVLRGEIDNRQKGIVRGRIWVHGRAEPITLELTGDAHPDLAGCLLTFRNPQKTAPDPHLDSVNPVQSGVVGDFTASRKVRVFDLPIEEAYAMLKRGEKVPEHMANCLYLEWYSTHNGRVVIESADYQLDVSAPAWRMTAEENAERAKNAELNWDRFVQQLNAALEKQRAGAKDPEVEWDEHDYERFMKECDARTDKYMELLEKYGDSAEAEARIAKEMGWVCEEGDEFGTDETRFGIEEMNRICEESVNAPFPEPDPQTEGKDWIRTASGDIRHPLQHRCFESALKFWQECEALGLERSDDPDLQEFIFKFQTTSVKLAGALDGFAQGRGFRDAAFTVAYLKRALNHLHQAHAGLENAAMKSLLPEKMVAEARKEMFDIREGILRLMDEFRGRS